MLATYFPLLISAVLGQITIVECFETRLWEKRFFNNEISLPVAECLEDSPTFGKVPYFLVGDQAFPLQSWLLRQYPGQGMPEEQRIFNYRLSRKYCRKT